MSKSKKHSLYERTKQNKSWPKQFLGTCFFLFWRGFLTVTSHVGSSIHSSLHKCLEVREREMPRIIPSLCVCFSFKLNSFFLQIFLLIRGNGISGVPSGTIIPSQLVELNQSCPIRNKRVISVYFFASHCLNIPLNI